MNRKQFLTELTQYLTFFSPTERAEIIENLNEKFDSVGPEGESALLSELGTPMTTVIDLKRRKEAGKAISSTFISVKVSTDEGMDQYSVETETYETITAPEGIDEVLQADEPEVLMPATNVKEQSSSAKHIFSIIGSAILSIFIAVAFLVIAAAGVILVIAMCYLLLTGLQCLHYITDALLLFGGGLVCGGVGLTIVWFAVWSAISLISKLFRSVGKSGNKECAV